MFSKMKKQTRHILTALSLCLTLALVMEMAPVRAATTFDQKVAANGTGFVKLSDAEKTDFLLFGSHAKYADGMQGRWKMLTRDQVSSVTNNASAKAAFGSNSYIWNAGSNYSTTADGKVLQIETNVSGVDLVELARSYGISSNVNTHTQLTAIDKTGSKARTSSSSFEKQRYFFDSISSTEGVPVNPVLKVNEGSFSLRVGQAKATETTAIQWKDDLKALQIDTVTTATQRPDIVLTVVDGSKVVEYVMSDIVDAGQYKAEFAYRDGSDTPVTVSAEGVRLQDVLAERSIRPAAGDTVYAVDDQGAKTQLKSSIDTYFLAYKGTVQAAGVSDGELTSNSEFCLLGPGSKESEVRLDSVYSIEVVRKPTPAPVVTPKATKIVKLTKKKKTITVKWKKMSGINGYQVSMATKKKGKYKVIKTITKASTIKFTKKKLKKGKNYYFKVRTYRIVNGKKYFSSWSAVKHKKL